MARLVPSLIVRHFGLVALAAVVVSVAACGGTADSAGPSTGPSTSGVATIAPPASATPAPATPSPAPSATASPSPTALAPAATGPLSPVTISLPLVAKGLPHPIAIANAGDSRLFVVDQAGQILIVDGGKVIGTFLDISARVNYGGERGLLGLAFHPQYATNGRFFVRYNIGNGDIRVSEFHVGSNPSTADPNSEKVLLTIPHQQFPNHNGGVIHFGPDGLLYIGTGDGGSGGDPNNNGQNLGVLAGKLLRIDVDHISGSLPYGIPSDNPFGGQAGKRAEIWAYGLRNPYSFSFDRQTGDLWLPDVGQNAYEEVNVARAADGLGKGANYGWSVMEASHCFKPASGCNTAGKVWPIAEYSHGPADSNGCAIIGGYVYRGTAHPELSGRYFFGDYCSGRIWDLSAAIGASGRLQQLLDTTIPMTGWGEGSDGELYVVGADGSLYNLA